MLRAKKLYDAYAALDVAVDLINGGFAEHTMVGKIQNQAVKARADYIVPKQYIVDVKTTSMPSDVDVFKDTVTAYSYHLSAALYLEIAEQTYGAPHDFYWMVLSKEDGQCNVYKASDATLHAGKVLVTSAIRLYNQCVATGVWQLSQPKPDRSNKEYEIVEI